MVKTPTMPKARIVIVSMASIRLNPFLFSNSSLAYHHPCIVCDQQTDDCLTISYLDDAAPTQNGAPQRIKLHLGICEDIHVVKRITDILSEILSGYRISGRCCCASLINSIGTIRYKFDATICISNESQFSCITQVLFHPCNSRFEIESGDRFLRD